ncbi:MAG: hypothetical protein RJA49_2740 [Actinomycetota bacterium]
MVRVITLCAVAALVAGCSGSDGGGTADGSSATSPAPGQTGDVGATGPTTTIAPTTTFMPDCAGMPTPAAIGAAIGVPVADGQVTGSGTCQYLGLNDQSRTVTLSLFTDPADQAAFNDLQSSLGAPKPYKDAKIPGAEVGADSTLFVTANGAIYTVLTLVTDQSPAEQVPLSAALLAEWLTL